MEFGADAVELIVQKESASNAGQPQPRYMRRLTDEAVRLLDDLRSGKLENCANFILSECFREAASAFSMINQQLKRDGYAARHLSINLHLACQYHRTGDARHRDHAA